VEGSGPARKSDVGGVIIAGWKEKGLQPAALAGSKYGGTRRRASKGKKKSAKSRVRRRAESNQEPEKKMNRRDQTTLSKGVWEVTTRVGALGRLGVKNLRRARKSQGEKVLEPCLAGKPVAKKEQQKQKR